MNSTIQDRFTEMLMTVDLLPSFDEMSAKVMEGEIELESVVFPNLTDGLADPQLSSALLCHTLAAPDQWQMQFTALLSNSAMRSMDAKVVAGLKPDANDLNALSLAATIMWSAGFFGGTAHTMTIIAQVCDSTGLDVPASVRALFRTNAMAGKIAAIDPYDVLRGDITPDKVFRFVTGAV